MSKYSVTEKIDDIEFTFWSTGGVRCKNTDIFTKIDKELFKAIYMRLFQLYPKRIVPSERTILTGFQICWIDYNKNKVEYGPAIGEAIYWNEKRNAGEI